MRRDGRKRQLPHWTHDESDGGLWKRRIAYRKCLYEKEIKRATLIFSNIKTCFRMTSRFFSGGVHGKPIKKWHELSDENNRRADNDKHTLQKFDEFVMFLHMLLCVALPRCICRVCKLNSVRIQSEAINVCVQTLKKISELTMENIIEAEELTAKSSKYFSSSIVCRLLSDTFPFIHNQRATFFFRWEHHVIRVTRFIQCKCDSHPFGLKRTRYPI